jgi:hypothetical protein
MTYFTTSGTQLAVSATPPATFNEAGYEAGTYTKIGEVTDLGARGRQYALVTHQPIESEGDKKGKGGFNAGSQAFTVALDRADAGQIIMANAANSRNNYYFKETEPDGTVTYYEALVMGWNINKGTRDNIVTATTTLEIQQRDGVDFITIEPD